VSDVLSIHIPITLRQRGGRKEIVLPDGSKLETDRPQFENTLIKALARAFRWKRLLESGEFATIAELAEREGIAPSYMTRVLRLALLAPDIIDAILDGRQGAEVTLARLLEPFPLEWAEQRVFRRSARKARSGP
jgi:hypothetical protein